MNKASDSGRKLFIAAIAVIAAMFLVIIFSGRESPQTAETDTPDITETPSTVPAAAPALSTDPPDPDDTASKPSQTKTPPATTPAPHTAKATVQTAATPPTAVTQPPPAPPGFPPPPPPPERIIITPQSLEQETLHYHQRFQAAKTIEAVNFTPLAFVVRNHPAPSEIREIVFPAPNGNSFVMTVTQHNVIDVDRGVFSGSISGKPLSEVIVSYYQDAVTGSVIIPGEGHYEIAPTGDGNHLLIEIDPDKILPEAQPLIPPVDGDD